MTSITTKFHHRALTLTLTHLLHCTLTTQTETQSQKLDRIATELLSLSKLECHDYSILFRHKLGLHKFGGALSGVSGVLSAAGATPKVEKVEEKTAFDIKLEKFDVAAKIKIIKEVRTFTDLGLKEAKELVEKVPVVLKKGVTKEEASPIIEKLKALGTAAAAE